MSEIIKLLAGIEESEAAPTVEAMLKRILETIGKLVETTKKHSTAIGEIRTDIEEINKTKINNLKIVMLNHVEQIKTLENKLKLQGESLKKYHKEIESIEKLINKFSRESPQFLKMFRKVELWYEELKPVMDIIRIIETEETETKIEEKMTERLRELSRRRKVPRRELGRLEKEFGEEPEEEFEKEPEEEPELRGFEEGLESF
ncbi:MAG: hypothetical protein GF317_06080 [Candidatus Lokiarchaeota archaeon]|nr:hypothetical protein [Candidatus Lokiarchaeota archaeon]